MVNTGRPSRACGACRERRVKCDETRPVCRKCIRTGRECPGYMTGFKLRDQTQETILKATMKQRDRGRGSAIPGASLMKSGGSKKKTAATTTKTTTTTTMMMCSESPSTIARDSPCRFEDADEFGEYRLSGLMAGEYDALHWRTVTTPLAEQARCYFLSSYVVCSPENINEGMFMFIPELLMAADPLQGYQHFDDLLTACAIATFAMRPNSGHALSFARLYYARGVSELRKTLAGKESAKSDYALASTILLGFYEGLVNDGSKTLLDNKHFHGALALLRMRGDEQFATQHGVEMFNFVMQVVLRQFQPVLTLEDEDLRRWTTHASMHSSNAARHLRSMCFANLRVRIGLLLQSEQRTAETIEEATRLLAMAQNILIKGFAAEEKELLRNTSPSTSSTLSSSSSSSSDEDLEDDDFLLPVTYPDWWTATRALNRHALRLLLCHIIADASAWLGRSPSEEAAAMARDDISSIIAAIPFLCTWDAAAAPRGATSPCGRADCAASVEGITSLLVIWPLWLAGSSPFARPAQSEYIQQRLVWIGKEFGVKHAIGISQHLMSIVESMSCTSVSA